MKDFGRLHPSPVVWPELQSAVQREKRLLQAPVTVGGPSAVDFGSTGKGHWPPDWSEDVAQEIDTEQRKHQTAASHRKPGEIHTLAKITESFPLFCSWAIWNKKHYRPGEVQKLPTNFHEVSFTQAERGGFLDLYWDLALVLDAAENRTTATQLFRRRADVGGWNDLK